MNVYDDKETKAVVNGLNFNGLTVKEQNELVEQLVKKFREEKNVQKALENLNDFFLSIKLEDQEQKEKIKALLEKAVVNPIGGQPLSSESEVRQQILDTLKESVATKYLPLSSTEIELLQGKIKKLNEFFKNAHVQAQIQNLTQLATQVQVASQQKIVSALSPTANPVVPSSVPAVPAQSESSDLSRRLNEEIRALMTLLIRNDVIANYQEIKQNSHRLVVEAPERLQISQLEKEEMDPLFKCLRKLGELNQQGLISISNVFEKSAPIHSVPLSRYKTENNINIEKQSSLGF